MNLEELILEHPEVEQLANKAPNFFINPYIQSFDSIQHELDIALDDVKKAEKLLKRFRPYLRKVFPSLVYSDGIIESPIQKIDDMKDFYRSQYGINIEQSVFVKRDDLLDIAGSVKARGGIYEVLKYAEKIAEDEMIIESDEDYSQFATDRFKQYFAKKTIVTGSTGNLGLSIGIMSAKLGFNVIIHMSKDAKQWKKDLLRSHGAKVIEHEKDYSEAVKEGRILALKNKNSYFIDDEDSKHLFIGYAVSALRLQEQLDKGGITVDENHPLYVYLPCGVGGAPGGITFGLKHIFGDNVRAVICEPVESPSMTLGVLTKKHHKINVRDIGLTNHTDADGLAVARTSKFISKIMGTQFHSFITETDDELFRLLKKVRDLEGVKIEPSAAIGYKGPVVLNQNIEVEKNASHLIWSTGGSLIPTDDYVDYYERGASLLH